MRSWPLLRARAAEPALEPESYPCARAGCDEDTGSDVAPYCGEKCQVEDALDRLNTAGGRASPQPPPT